MKRMTMLEITRDGKIDERLPENDAEGVLDDTLLIELYPDIHVAMVSLPQGALDLREESMFSNLFECIEWGGIRYKLIGGSGSVKNRKYYFVDEAHRDEIAKRFARWPEGLITYFGILVSPCKSRIKAVGIRILIVRDRTFGTNADRAWLRQRLFDLLRLMSRRFYQFRLAFLFRLRAEIVATQAKGGTKVMDDDVADFLGVDIILPESCIKPAFPEPIPEGGLPIQADIVLGIREVSRLLTFESSASLIVNAPKESIQLEIIPAARVFLSKVRGAFSASNHPALVELLGRKVPDNLADGEESEETPQRTIEAVLLADGSGELTRQPYIHQQLSKTLTHSMYKTLTGGGIELPAFALADDGYLFLHEGQVHCKSDWLSLDTAITSVSAPYGLCARYPIRMREDLLPMIHMHAEQVAADLMFREHIDATTAERIAHTQICLQGVYVLHSETAKRNGGDFDFDQICVIDGDKYLHFVAWRFNLTERPPITKDKKDKARSPWFNFEDAAIEAGGNKIGLITNLKVSCTAAGREDLEYILVGELQNEIDSLKWGTRSNQAVLKDIQKEVPMAPWLELKWLEKVTDFPKRLEVLPTDVIGDMYNTLRPDVSDMFQEPLPIRSFKGLIKGNAITRNMIREVRFVGGAYGAAHKAQMDRVEKTRLRLTEAEKRYTELKATKDAELDQLKSQAKAAKGKAAASVSERIAKLWDQRELAYEKLRDARTSFQTANERYRSKAAQLAKIIRDWGNGKTENRRGWAEAAHQSACRGTGKGSILFLAFPQEAVDMIAERTGGIRTEVYKPANSEIVIIDEDRFYRIGDNGRPKFVLRYERATQTVHWRNK
jgi:hypothetical protein